MAEPKVQLWFGDECGVEGDPRPRQRWVKRGSRPKVGYTGAHLRSSVIGAVAALLTAPLITLDPTLMWDPLLKGFAAAVLGGLNTPIGAVLGGYLLGIIENLFGAYVSVEFKSVVAFLIIVVVLWFRPSGLFGRHHERKV